MTESFTAGPLPRWPLPDGVVAPRVPWRGVHLDVARHWFPIPVIKRYLDILAAHRMTVFHWHLTDDQGWRIAVPDLPELERVAAWREGPRFARHGGIYHADEIAEVVEYATALGIHVLPEIEMPGHARAALAAFPELSCTGARLSVPATWGIFEDVFCAGNEAVFGFLATVLDEVVRLFPGEYVHVGGDECPKSRWEQCPRCQQRMGEHDLPDEFALQAWFIDRVAGMLRDRGRRLIGWDEILEGGPDRNVTVMAWRSTGKAREAAERGHEVILCPTSHCYFDHGQARLGEPRAFPAVLPLRRVYEFNPLPDGWSANERSRISGAQVNLWTERISTENHLQYMLLPRLCAFTDTLFIPPEHRDWREFRSRLNRYLRKLDTRGISYRPT